MNLTEAVASTRRSQLATSNIAKALALEAFNIFDDPRVKSNLGFPVTTYFFDITTLPKETQKILEALDANASFARFNPQKSVYEIFVSTFTEDFSNKRLDRNGFINFRGKKINLADDTFALTREMTLSVFRHELAHIIISNLINLKKLDKQSVPFSLINIAEDVRVNSFWNFDKNYQVLLNPLFKISPELQAENKTGYDIFFPVCVTLDDPKYYYKSPDYPFVKEIFKRILDAVSINEVVSIVKDFLDEMEKRHPKAKMTKSMMQARGKVSGGGKADSEKKKSAFDAPEDSVVGENYDDDDDEFIDPMEKMEEEKSKQDVWRIEEKEDAQEKDINSPDILSDEGDLLGGLSPEEQDEIIDEIKKVAVKINEDGNLTKNNKESKFHDKKTTNRDSNLEKQKEGKGFSLLPSAKSVEKDDIELSMSIVRSCTQKAKQELKKYFPFTEEDESSEFSKNLNKRKLHTLPFNPTYENIFLEKTNKVKEPVKLTFFFDLSGSMSGFPLNTAKHLIAVLKNLQDAKFIDVALVFHASITKKDYCTIVKLSKLKDKPFERISAIKTHYNEAFINALHVAKREIRGWIKDSRFNIFLTDGNINDKAEDVREALKIINQDKTIGMYMGKYYNSEGLSEYFDNYISYNYGRNTEEENIRDNVLKEAIDAICKMANPDMNASAVIRQISKNDNLVTSFGKSKIYTHSTKADEPEKNTRRNRIKI